MSLIQYLYSGRDQIYHKSLWTLLDGYDHAPTIMITYYTQRMIPNSFKNENTNCLLFPPCFYLSQSVFEAHCNRTARVP